MNHKAHKFQEETASATGILHTRQTNDTEATMLPSDSPGQKAVKCVWQRRKQNQIMNSMESEILETMK